MAGRSPAVTGGLDPRSGRGGRPKGFLGPSESGPARSQQRGTGWKTCGGVCGRRTLSDRGEPPLGCVRSASDGHHPAGPNGRGDSGGRSRLRTAPARRGRKGGTSDSGHSAEWPRGEGHCPRPLLGPRSAFMNLRRKEHNSTRFLRRGSGLHAERSRHERCPAWHGRGAAPSGGAQLDIRSLERNRFAVKGGESSRLEVKDPVSASVPYR